MGFLDRLLAHASYDTMFGRADVITMPASDGRPVRILRLDGTYQSASFEGEGWADLAFAYYQGFDAIFQARDGGRRIEDVLLLGGGGFAWPKHVLTRDASVHLDVVEVDPAIVRIARERFYLDELEALLATEGRAEDLRIIVDDAVSYLAQTPKRYDAIINDIFQGSIVPEDTTTEGFIASIKRCLDPGGIYAQNVIVDLTREGAYQLFALMSRLDDSFAHVCAVDSADAEFGGADNYIVLASDAEHPFADAIGYGD